MKVFITGGSGFVGANLVDGLNKIGIRPRLLLRSNSSHRALEGLDYDVVLGDVLEAPDELASKMEDCSWVFHVAAVADYWRQGVELLYTINVTGSRHVAQAALQAGAERFVYTSSVAALGFPPKGQLLDEDSEFNLDPQQFPYGHSKLLAEYQIARVVEQGLRATIVNPSIILGPRDVNLISGSIIIEAARGLGLAYPIGGSNYVAVEDVVAGHIAAAENGNVGERYVLGGNNLTYRESLEVICDVVGQPMPRIAIPRWIIGPLATTVHAVKKVAGNRIPFDANHVRMSTETVYVDNTKSLKAFKIPVTPFREVVERTYFWYKQNGFIR